MFSRKASDEQIVLTSKINTVASYHTAIIADSQTDIIPEMPSDVKLNLSTKDHNVSDYQCVGGMRSSDMAHKISLSQTN